MTKGFHNSDRSVLRITGADRISFLEGLVSNAVARTKEGAVYAAMLGPQGKYLFDFILTAKGDAILLDIATDRAAALVQRLSMYRLRADVQIELTDVPVSQGLGEMPEGAFTDPRSPDIGWRKYGDVPVMDAMDVSEWTALRIARAIPESGLELIPDDTYILEAGFERLNGVDFRKGCYVGQEITARMKHKTELKKGLVRVSLTEDIPAGTPITTNGKPAGTLFSNQDGVGLAHLRFDRATGDMQAGDATVRRV